MSIGVYSVDGSLILVTTESAEAMAVIRTTACKGVLIRRDRHALPLNIRGSV